MVIGVGVNRVRTKEASFLRGGKGVTTNLTDLTVEFRGGGNGYIPLFLKPCIVRNASSPFESGTILYLQSMVRS